MTVRDLAASLARIAAGAPAPKTAVPYPMLWTAGLFSPLLREPRATGYQWIRPFVLDSALTERTFGLRPAPLDEVLAALADRAAVSPTRTISQS